MKGKHILAMWSVFIQKLYLGDRVQLVPPIKNYNLDYLPSIGSLTLT